MVGRSPRPDEELNASNYESSPPTFRMKGRRFLEYIGSTTVKLPCYVYMKTSVPLIDLNNTIDLLDGETHKGQVRS